MSNTNSESENETKTHDRPFEYIWKRRDILLVTAPLEFTDNLFKREDIDD